MFVCGGGGEGGGKEEGKGGGRGALPKRGIPPYFCAKKGHT